MLSIPHRTQSQKPLVATARRTCGRSRQKKSVQKKLTTIFMKQILIVLFSTVVLNANAQYYFSISDLQKICKMTSNDFDTFLVGKGYYYDSQISNEKTIIYRNTIDPNMRVLRTSLPNEPIFVDFNSGNSQYYLNLKTKVLTVKNAWKYVGERLTEPGGQKIINYRFAKSNFIVELYSAAVNDTKRYAIHIYSIKK